MSTPTIYDQLKYVDNCEEEFRQLIEELRSDGVGDESILPRALNEIGVRYGPVIQQTIENRILLAYIDGGEVAA